MRKRGLYIITGGPMTGKSILTRTLRSQDFIVYDNVYLSALEDLKLKHLIEEEWTFMRRHVAIIVNVPTTDKRFQELLTVLTPLEDHYNITICTFSQKGDIQNA